MFDAYDNLSENYIPDNMHYFPPAIALSINDNNINTKTNCQGQITGFSWNYGDTVSIPLSLNLNINIYPNDVVKDVSGLEPDQYIKADEGDRYYNIKDLLSWRLDAIIEIPGYSFLEEEPQDFQTNYYNYYELIEGEYLELSEETSFIPNTYFRSNNIYVWVKDEKLTFFSDGVTPITLSPDMTNKQAIVKLSNFRHEELFNFKYEEENTFNVEITQEISETLNPGIYFLSLSLYDTEAKTLSLVKVFDIYIKNKKII